MNDRALTELAAKAAGYEYVQPLYDKQLVFYTHEIILPDGKFADWNPLADDGAALRLAVKLDIGVEKTNDLKYPKSKTKWCTVTAKTQDGFEAVEYEHPAPCAATRRAIVRAAAEIGKMKGEK